MIRNIKGELNEELISKLKKYFKWTAFCVGENVVSVTPSGGVHWTGKRRLFPAVMFEVVRKNTYFVVHLNQYPNGIIFHVHIFSSQIDKLTKEQINEVIDSLYKEVNDLVSSEG
jgi:hypothetical protein